MIIFHLHFNIILLFNLIRAAHGQLALEYDKDMLYEIFIQNTRQLETVREMENNPDGYVFYNDYYVVNSTVKLIVPPRRAQHFQNLTQIINLKVKLIDIDKNSQFDRVRITRSSHDAIKHHCMHKFDWTSYHTLTQMYEWLDHLVAQYPNILTLIVGGVTFEGREIRGIKLAQKENLPIIVIDSNIHAREWITSATTTWMLNELLTSKDETVRRISRSYEWHFFPVINPDGFEYSHTTDRLWRKTRSKNSNPHCPGVDMNRNWNFHFMNSSSPCAQTYSGLEAFSEIETKTLSVYYKSLKNILIYLSFHSFSQYIIIPYGHTTKHLDNYADLIVIGREAIKKIYEKYGTEYGIGTVPEFIHEIATGSSGDWMKGVLKVPITYTFELRDKGHHGFELPTNQIIPTAEETFDSVLVIILETERLGYLIKENTSHHVHTLK